VPKDLARSARNAAFRLIIWQMLLTLVISLVLLSYLGLVQAFSAFAGGMICILPNIYFAIKAFSYGGARAAKQIVRAFYLGEAIKIVMTAGLFALAYIALPVDIKIMLLTFICIQFMAWLAPWIFKDYMVR